MKQRVLFLCRYNSCRSQMAEGLINHYHGDRFEAFSAGIETKPINHMAFRVLAQLGIDITRQYSKTLSAFKGEQFDYVISLCNDNDVSFPLFIGGVKRVDIGFPDPSVLTGTEKDLMSAFQKLRDEMRDRLTAHLLNG
jgi:arsenate reductase